MILALLLACSSPDPPAPTHHRFDTPAEALRHVLRRSPKVLAVGELHAREGTEGITPAMDRFTTELLPVLAPRTTDLVLETWSLDGRCGEVEVALDQAVARDTRRSEQTPSSLARLALAARSLGVRPHRLTLTCDQQEAIHAGGTVDYGLLLSTLAEGLGRFAREALTRPDATMVLYSGAVHNDREPSDDTRSYSYAADLEGVVELDLYVPEILGTWPTMVEPAWAPRLDEVGPDHVILIERGPASWVLLLRTGR